MRLQFLGALVLLIAILVALTFLDVILVNVGFLRVTLKDVVDVGLITAVAYSIHRVIRGTRGAQMMVGLLFIFLIFFINGFLHMSGTSWLIENLKTVWIIAFVILFQPELRRLLIAAGQNRLVRVLVGDAEHTVQEKIAGAVVELSQKRYGGLLVLVGDTGIRAIVETGQLIQAPVSTPLLVSLFVPRSPMHDGAVVINGQMVEAAKCILPLTQNLQKVGGLGTRHQAAVGLSEESDATIIVVSEETGQISIAYKGELVRNLDHPLLHAALVQGPEGILQQPDAE